MPPIDPKHGFWEMAAASIIHGLLSTETRIESNLQPSQIRGLSPPDKSQHLASLIYCARLSVSASPTVALNEYKEPHTWYSSMERDASEIPLMHFGNVSLKSWNIKSAYNALGWCRVTELARFSSLLLLQFLFIQRNYMGCQIRLFWTHTVARCKIYSVYLYPYAQRARFWFKCAWKRNCEATRPAVYLCKCLVRMSASLCMGLMTSLMKWVTAMITRSAFSQNVCCSSFKIHSKHLTTNVFTLLCLR